MNERKRRSCRDRDKTSLARILSSWARTMESGGSRRSWALVSVSEGIGPLSCERSGVYNDAR
jgi:hypothetical protein